MARPSKYRPEFAEQARKLCKLGATDHEVGLFFDRGWSEDDYLAFALMLIRLDRRGVSAARKEQRRAMKRASSSPSKRIRNAVSARMWAALKGRKDFRLFDRLGYSQADLMAHLESRFQVGMTWENYGQWHVDHIRPCAVFDLTQDGQFDQCWALDNLQPLWAEANLRKGAR